MKSRVQTILVLLVLLFTLALTSCVVFGNQLDSQDSKVINQQIRDAIEKTIPLPENAAIRTHIGDEITFSSELSADKVAAFYQDAYSQKGYQEAEGQILADQSTLLFNKEGEKAAVVEIIGKEKGCDVHILLKPTNP